MEPIDLSNYNGNQIQTFIFLINAFEGQGVTDSRFIRQQISGHFEKIRKDFALEERKAKKKKDNSLHIELGPDEIENAKKIEAVVKRAQKLYATKTSRIPCPICEKAYLQIKKREDVTYTACPQCFKTVEFK